MMEKILIPLGFVGFIVFLSWWSYFLHLHPSPSEVLDRLKARHNQCLAFQAQYTSFQVRPGLKFDYDGIVQKEIEECKAIDAWKE